MFLLTFVIAILFLFVVLAIVHTVSDDRVGAEALCALPVTLFMGFIAVMGGGLPMLATAGALTLYIIVSVFREPDPKKFIRGTLYCFGGGYLLASVVIGGWVHEDNRVRDKYPFVSLRGRMPEQQMSAAQQITPVVLTPETENHMGEIENLFDEQGEMRKWGLMEIHKSSVQKFLESPGFGFVRMYRFGEHSIEHVDRSTRSIRAADEFPLQLQSTPTFQYWLADEFQLPASDQPFWATHVTSQLSFGFQDYYGLIEDVDHVAGFQSHQFRDLPLYTDQGKAQLTQLQLVSLLKHSQPRVYVSNELPNMEDLDDTNLRDLTDFEIDALQQLHDGEDLVVREEGNQIEMVGSLRAMKQCLQCHEVKRGTLLGAFSYQLEMK